MELRLTKQICLRLKAIEIVNVLSKGTALLYFKRTEAIVLQGRLKPAKGIKGVRLKLSFHMPAANLTNITVNIPKDMILFASSDSMVSIIDRDPVQKERRLTVDTVQASSRSPATIMNTTMSQTPENIAYKLSKYLQNTPFIIPELSTCSNISKKCGMSIMNKSIHPPLQLRLLFRSQINSCCTVPSRSESARG